MKATIYFVLALALLVLEFLVGTRKSRMAFRSTR
jgi:hypothetical protein